jgi:hypothetical protein
MKYYHLLKINIKETRMKTKKQIRKEWANTVMRYTPDSNTTTQLKDAGQLANEIINFDPSSTWNIPSLIYTKIVAIRKHRDIPNKDVFLEEWRQHEELFESISDEQAVLFREELGAISPTLRTMHVHLLEVWLVQDRHLRHNCRRSLQRAGDTLEHLGYVYEDGHCYTLTEKGKALLHLYPSY